MISKFTAKYISEPDLIFGNKCEDKDPRIGLKHFGPYFFDDEDFPLESVRIGIIGNKKCVSLAKKILQLIEQPVCSQKSNRWLFVDYPGMNNRSKFKCVIKTSDNWNASLSNDLELAKIENVEDPNERIGYAVDLYLQKIRNIAEGDNQPNVIICTLPKPVENYCGIGEHILTIKSLCTAPHIFDWQI